MVNVRSKTKSDSEATGALVTSKSYTKSYQSIQKQSKMEWKQDIERIQAIYMSYRKATPATCQIHKIHENTKPGEITMGVVCKLMKRMKNPKKHHLLETKVGVFIKKNLMINKILRKWDWWILICWGRQIQIISSMTIQYREKNLCNGRLSKPWHNSLELLNSQDINWCLSQFNLGLNSKIHTYQGKVKFRWAKPVKASVVNAVKKDLLFWIQLIKMKKVKRWLINSLLKVIASWLVLRVSSNQGLDLANRINKLNHVKQQAPFSHITRTKCLKNMHPSKKVLMRFILLKRLMVSRSSQAANTLVLLTLVLKDSQTLNRVLKYLRVLSNKISSQHRLLWVKRIKRMNRLSCSEAKWQLRPFRDG